MFVVCPKCSAKYQIPAEITLKPGQKLQCSACQHAFYWTGEPENEVAQKTEDTVSTQPSQSAEAIRPTLNPKPVIPALTVADETNLLPATEVVQTLPEAFRPLKPLKHSSFSPLWVVLSFILVGGIAYLTWQHRDLLISYLPTNTRISLPRPEIESVPAVQKSEPQVAVTPKIEEVVPVVSENIPVQQPQQLEIQDVKTDNRIADRKTESYQPTVKENSIVADDTVKVQLPSDVVTNKPIVAPNVDKTPVAMPAVTTKVEPTPDVEAVVAENVVEKSPVVNPTLEVKTAVVQPVVESNPIKTETDAVAPKVFSFQSVRFRVMEKQGQNSVLMEGFVHNDSDTQQPTPKTLLVTAYNPQGTPLFTKEVFMPNGMIDSMARKPFFGTYAPAPKDIQWIDVSVKE